MTRYFEAFVGESPLLEFRLEHDGLPQDVSTGRTITLSGEDDADGTALSDVTCASDETGADWVNGIVTVRAAASDRPRRLLVALVVAAGEEVESVQDGVLVVRHRPGLADATG